MTDTERPFQEPTWAIVELMGHVVLAGEVSEQTMFGKAMLRIDHPEQENCQEFTQYISPDAIYRITPTSEEITTSIARDTVARPAVLYNLEHRLSRALLKSGDDEGDPILRKAGMDELEYENDEEVYGEIP